MRILISLKENTRPVRWVFIGSEGIFPMLVYTFLLKRWCQMSGVSVQAGVPMLFFPDTRNLTPETSFLRTVESGNYFQALSKDAAVSY